MRAAAFAFAVLIFAGCTRRDVGDGIVVRSSTCIRCGAPERVGALASREMDETSGAVSSSTSDDIYFGHNDSGDSARFFAFDRSGSLLGTFVYSKDDVIDCEDIARGACDGTTDPGKSCLFIADIGDNHSRRDHITLYRVVEPTVIHDAKVSSDRILLKYPDGPHDAETLLIHPLTGVITIVTKVAKGSSGIYEVPMPFHPDVLTTLIKVGTLTSPAGSPRFTSGSVKPDGRGILLRTYTHVYYVPMKPEDTVAKALASPLCSLPVAPEDQGETIAWLRGGDGFLTTSEGRGADLHVVHCE